MILAVSLAVGLFVATATLVGALVGTGAFYDT